jgi:hypothetical protein
MGGTNPNESTLAQQIIQAAICSFFNVLILFALMAVRGSFSFPFKFPCSRGYSLQ